MWRKGVSLQALIFSCFLLAGPAEARQAGLSGRPAFGPAGQVGSGLGFGSTKSTQSRSGMASVWANVEGEAGSLINPDGLRAAGTINLFTAGVERKGRLVRLAFDPHG